jgi:hypothetical protein
MANGMRRDACRRARRARTEEGAAAKCINRHFAAAPSVVIADFRLKKRQNCFFSAVSSGV